MTIHFDDKGKFFTEVISKETIEAIIQTTEHRIHGEIHVRPGERLKDEINCSEQFLAVTKAVVFDSHGAEVYRCSFMAVNREHIVWLIPTAELVRGQDRPGGEA